MKFYSNHIENRRQPKNSSPDLRPYDDSRIKQIVKSQAWSIVLTMNALVTNRCNHKMLRIKYASSTSYTASAILTDFINLAMSNP